MDGNFGTVAAYITPYDNVFKFCRYMLCGLPREEGMFPIRLLMFFSDVIFFFSGSRILLMHVRKHFFLSSFNYNR